MNPLALVISVIRKSYNKTGATSAIEAGAGGLAAFIAVAGCRHFGVELSETEVGMIYSAGPTISSYVLGTIRHVYNDIMMAFQRGTSEPRSVK